MPLAPPPIHPYALTTYDRAVSYLKQDKNNDSADLELWVSGLMNAVTDRIERDIGRPLHVRNYRTAFSVNGTTANASTSVTGITTTNVKEFDEVTGTGIQDGTLVDSVGATSITLTKEAIASGTVSLTFGSQPLAKDFRYELTPEGYWKVATGIVPLQSVYSVKWADANGNLTALDLTGMRIKSALGVVVLPIVAPPDYSSYIQLECTGGYMPPKTGTNRGLDGWSNLENIALRGIQIMWQDRMNAAGRGGNSAPMGMSTQVGSFSWPDDIQAVINSMRVYW